MATYSGGIDKLSSLPDAIICEILSFLPTRDAVKTSLLSPRFVNLWKNITTLRFSHHDPIQFPEKLELRRFATFVDFVLQNLHSRNIHQFSIQLSPLDLICVHIIEDDVSDWLADAVARNVKIVEVSSSFACYFPWVYLPDCFYNCNSIEVLDVRESNVMLNAPTLVSLPNLRTLHLETVCFQWECVDKLISASPSLQTLYLRINESYNVARLSICSPSLEHITIISADDKESLWDQEHNLDSTLHIDTPALKFLKINHPMLKDFSMKTSPSLIQAEICVGASTWRSETSRNLIQSLSNVKILSFDVSSNWLKSFGRSSVLPMFPNLNELTLYIVCCEWKFVKDFLQKSPKLEFLAMKFCTYCSYNNINSFEESNLNPGSMTSLKIVSIDYYSGSIGELKLLEHILLNAWLLKTVEISTHHEDSGKRLELLQLISKLRRRSMDCRIKFV